MKKYCFYALIFTSIYSCKKDKEIEPIPVTIVAPTVYSNFSQLKVGNYWIYQRFNVDSIGNATPTSVYDSCYVEKDTIINSITYYKLVKPSISSALSYSFLRDSLNYTVNHIGTILFSSQDFSTIFESNYLMAGVGDTLCHKVKKMTDQNMIVTTPAGTFITSNAKETYFMYPAWSFNGVKRERENRYSENIGIIIETLTFFVSNPNYTERRLLRYNLN